MTLFVRARHDEMLHEDYENVNLNDGERADETDGTVWNGQNRYPDVVKIDEAQVMVPIKS